MRRLKVTKDINEVKLEDFTRSFGTDVEDIPSGCCELIACTDFQYKVLAWEERDRVLLNVLRKIESDHQNNEKIEKRGKVANRHSPHREN